MCPCSLPAKNARRERRDGEGPPISPVVSPVRRLISGNEASLEGLKPSEVLALHKTLIDVLYNSGTDADAIGPCK